jgi:nucleoside-diphosphate-sugar epimerase
MRLDTVVITGASGTLGSFLTSEFLASGVNVIGVSRTAPESISIATTARNKVTTSVGHFTYAHADLTSDSNGLSFGDLPVIHCAASVRDGWDRKVLGDNLAMARAMLKLSTGPIVHLSSSSVYDLTKPSLEVSEDEATGDYRFLNSYSEAKWHTEELVRQSGRNAVILRPHGVYGPGDSTLLPRVQSAIRLGRFLPLPAGGKAVHALTSLSNIRAAVGGALVALLDGSVSGALAVNVTDLTAISLREAITAVLDDPVLVLPVPVSLALKIAAMADRRQNEGSESLLTEYAFSQLAYDRTYSLTRLRERLNVIPAESTIIELCHPIRT